MGTISIDGLYNAHFILLMVRVVRCSLYEIATPKEIKKTFLISLSQLTPRQPVPYLIREIRSKQSYNNSINIQGKVNNVKMIKWGG